MTYDFNLTFFDNPNYVMFTNCLYYTCLFFFLLRSQLGYTTLKNDNSGKYFIDVKDKIILSPKVWVIDIHIQYSKQQQLTESCFDLKSNNKFRIRLRIADNHFSTSIYFFKIMNKRKWFKWLWNTLINFVCTL